MCVCGVWRVYLFVCRVWRVWRVAVGKDVEFVKTGDLCSVPDLT
jgi:hypothetical protein